VADLYGLGGGGGESHGGGEKREREGGDGESACEQAAYKEARGVDHGSMVST